jgi:hypothetical protein
MDPLKESCLEYFSGLLNNSVWPNRVVEIIIRMREKAYFMDLNMLKFEGTHHGQFIETIRVNKKILS